MIGYIVLGAHDLARAAKAFTPPTSATWMATSSMFSAMAERLFLAIACPTNLYPTLEPKAADAS